MRGSVARFLGPVRLGRAGGSIDRARGKRPILDSRATSSGGASGVEPAPESSFVPSPIEAGDPLAWRVGRKCQVKSQVRESLRVRGVTKPKVEEIDERAIK